MWSYRTEYCSISCSELVLSFRKSAVWWSEWWRLQALENSCFDIGPLLDSPVFNCFFGHKALYCQYQCLCVVPFYIMAALFCELNAVLTIIIMVQQQKTRNELCVKLFSVVILHFELPVWVNARSHNGSKTCHINLAPEIKNTNFFCMISNWLCLFLDSSSSFTSIFFYYFVKFKCAQLHISVYLPL